MYPDIITELRHITLVLVAVLQLAYYTRHQIFFVFQNNTLISALLGLVFVVGWGALDRDAFNAPAWSISVELVLYVVFFLVCRLRLHRFAPTLLIALGSGLGAVLLPKLGGALAAFFIGGCCSDLVGWV